MISKKLDRVNVVVVDKELVSGSISSYPHTKYHLTISNTFIESGILGNNRGKALLYVYMKYFVSA